MQFQAKCFKFNTGVHAESYVRCIQRSLVQIQQNFPPELRTQISLPADLHWEEYPEQLDPFQGFTNTYKAYCDYYKTPFRSSVLSRLEEICTGIDQPGIDLDYCFQKCRNPPAGPKDALALISPVRTSELFVSVTAKDFPLDEDGLKTLFDVLRFNRTVQG